MSGDQSAGGRTCLRQGEVDPAGQAQLCQDGKDITAATVTPQPVVTALPQVGSDGSGVFIILIWVVAVIICIRMILKSRPNKDK